LEAARIRAGGEPSDVKLLAQALLDECERNLNAIRQGIAKNDAKLVRRGAHTLRGSADVFHATSVVNAAARLESMGQEGDLQGADTALADLERHVLQLQPELAMVASSDSD
jgi:HPt (histidine-containing phosphotransfer) domain-containing protein